jgi:hypothetical protein
MTDQEHTAVIYGGARGSGKTNLMLEELFRNLGIAMRPVALAVAEAAAVMQRTTIRLSGNTVAWTFHASPPVTRRPPRSGVIRHPSGRRGRAHRADRIACGLTTHSKQRPRTQNVIVAPVVYGRSDLQAAYAAFGPAIRIFEQPIIYRPSIIFGNLV